MRFSSLAFRWALTALAVAASSLSFAATTSQVEVVEYYNATLDHYFMTANADEISKLDAGILAGWVRTNVNFKAIPNDLPKPIGASPVCRFYGNPAAGLDSHFYSASTAECAAVRAQFPDAWIFEADNVFQVYLPDSTGKCADGLVPVFRAWNNRADEGHRYTTDVAVEQAMAARGYIGEGSGDPPVVMCTPASTDSVARPTLAGPSCEISSSGPAVIGSSVTLTAICTGAPTNYIWTGCTATGPTCIVTATSAGNRSYGVTAANNAGAGPLKSVAMAWQGNGTTPPTGACTLSAPSTAPTVGTTATITANCSGSPTSYQWTGCTGSGNTCAATSTAAGAKTYSMTTLNGVGTSSPASITLIWQTTSTTTPPVTPPTGPTPVCTVNANTLTPDTGAPLTLTATCTNNPTSYSWLTCSALLQDICNPIPSGCSAGSNVCTSTSVYSGSAHYAVQASNAAGAGTRVGIDIFWSIAQTAAPSCQVTLSNSSPVVNTSILATAVCTGAPTSYVWTNCSSTSGSCVATSSSTGAQTYSVRASNGLGSSAIASATANWQLTAVAAVPVCTVSAANANPSVGSGDLLTASCSNNPTSFVWTGCAGAGASCTASSNNLGPATYSVVATNATGPSAPASVTVSWQNVTQSPPSSCSITGAPSAAVAPGTLVSLSMTCLGGAPTSYIWSGGFAAGSTTQQVSGAVNATTSFGATASNAGGSGNASTTVFVNNPQTPPTGPINCPGYSTVLVDLNWSGSQGNVVGDLGGQSFGNNTMVVVRFTTPSGSSQVLGHIQAYEWPGTNGPVPRVAALSSSACDLSASLAPGASTAASTPNVYFRVGSSDGYNPGLSPNTTYYFNIVNRTPSGSSSCSAGSCPIRVELSKPSGL